MTKLHKQIPTWDLVMLEIQSLYLPFMLAILGGQFMISVILKPHLFSTATYKVPLIYLLLAFLLLATLSLYLTKLLNNPQSTDLKYSFEKALNLFYDSNSSLNPRKNKKSRLKASIIYMSYFVNIYVLFFPYYLFSSSPLPIKLTIIVQLLHIIFVIFFTYRKTAILIRKGFKNILKEQFNSSASQNYPPFSRFRLYSLNIITFIFWLFLFIY